MNAPNRFESFILGENEKPLEIIEDTKIPNAATIKIWKQDHTIANLVRAQLLSMPGVLFAGYKVPHPLEPYFILKVQTNGIQTPSVAVQEACKQIIETIAVVTQGFKRGFEEADIMGPMDQLGPGQGGMQGGWQQQQQQGGDYADL